jgi:hypothetical protein
MDDANNLFSAAFHSAFRYRSNSVQLTCTTAKTTLRFGVVAPAHALKPNFCYQMKLEGPSVAWPAISPQTRDFTNWALGSNGRWWDDTKNIPLTDDQLNSCAGDLVRGYLYFDFLVTAKDGSVNYTSTVNNSYHVAFTPSQQAQTVNDGPLRTRTVAAVADGWAYGKTHPIVVVTLYGQGEPDRPLPGSLSLPTGNYSRVRFRLTEESLHSTSTYGGNWDTVMVAGVPNFTIK